MNILRLIGQSYLAGNDAPIRREAKCQPIKAVPQELMFKGGA